MKKLPKKAIFFKKSIDRASGMWYYNYRKKKGD